MMNNDRWLMHHAVAHDHTQHTEYSRLQTPPSSILRTADCRLRLQTANSDPRPHTPTQPPSPPLRSTDSSESESKFSSHPLHPPQRETMNPRCCLRVLPCHTTLRPLTTPTTFSASVHTKSAVDRSALGISVTLSVRLCHPQSEVCG